MQVFYFLLYSKALKTSYISLFSKENMKIQSFVHFKKKTDACYIQTRSFISSTCLHNHLHRNQPQHLLSFPLSVLQFAAVFL